MSMQLRLLRRLHRLLRLQFALQLRLLRLLLGNTNNRRRLLRLLGDVMSTTFLD